MKSSHLKGAFDSRLLSEFKKELADHFMAFCSQEKKHLAIDELDMLREAHKKAKLSSNWSKAYSTIVDMNVWDKILSDYVPKLLKNLNLEPIAPLNFGIRIMEFDSERSYPLHQEWPDMETEHFVILWAPLHDLMIGNGCLLLEKEARKNKLEHCYNEMGYPVLPSEKTKDLSLDEIPMNAGDCLIFDPLCVHGSAKMHPNSASRFCFLIRYQIKPM